VPDVPATGAGLDALRDAWRDAVSLNLHVRDVGHTFMFGPTGAGKSTHLGIIAAQLRRYAGMSIFAFDKGMSMYPLAAAIRAQTGGSSGKHFTVAADDDALAFCPLQFLQTKGDRAWAMEWIDTILALNGVESTPGTAQRNRQRDHEYACQRRAARCRSSR
jgi:type IV secretory pathway VirB4 component